MASTPSANDSRLPELTEALAASIARHEEVNIPAEQQESEMANANRLIKEILPFLWYGREPHDTPAWPQVDGEESRQLIAAIETAIAGRQLHAELTPLIAKRDRLLAEVHLLNGFLRERLAQMATQK